MTRFFPSAPGLGSKLLCQRSRITTKRVISCSSSDRNNPCNDIIRDTSGFGEVPGPIIDNAIIVYPVYMNGAARIIDGNQVVEGGSRIWQYALKRDDLCMRRTCPSEQRKGHT